MANKQDKQKHVKKQVPNESDKTRLNSTEDNANNTLERTEQEEDLISPTADSDLVEGGIRNDSVLAGENNLSEMLPDSSIQDNASTKKNTDAHKDGLKTSNTDSKNESE